MIDAEVTFDHPRHEIVKLRNRQRGGPDFFPAASPRSGTTRPAAPGSDDDATRSSSDPDSRPSPPPPSRARSIPRSDAPPSPPAPAPPTTCSDPRSKNNNQTYIHHLIRE